MVAAGGGGSATCTLRLRTEWGGGVGRLQLGFGSWRGYLFYESGRWASWVAGLHAGTWAASGQGVSCWAGLTLWAEIIAQHSPTSCSCRPRPEIIVLGSCSCRVKKSCFGPAHGPGAFWPSIVLGIFLYLICHDFRKINGRIKIFEKCTSGAVPHGGRLLPPYPTTLSPCRRGARRLESGSCSRTGQRGARTLPPSGTAAGPYRRTTRRQGLFYFLFLVFDF
jgi:hypothetical protein